MSEEVEEVEMKRKKMWCKEVKEEGEEPEEDMNVNVASTIHTREP